MMSELSIPRAIDLALFQLDLLLTTLMSLKSIERDLLALGVDPRTLLGIAFRKQAEIDAKIKSEFPHWPEDSPMRRVFEASCEALFPSEGPDAHVPMRVRMRHAFEVAGRVRASVYEHWGMRAERSQADAAA
jgi:hypothetical protein